MKGVKQKLSVAKDTNKAADKETKVSRKERKANMAKPLTATQLASINRRLDQCLPLETPEWQRVEQLLMQLSEFAPTSLVYEAGMAVAVYADDQARRAYMLACEDTLAANANHVGKTKHEAA